MNFDLNSQISQAEENFGLGERKSSDWYKMIEGLNAPIRVLTAMTVFPQHFNPKGYSGICLGKEKGCPGCKEETNISVKWLCWILDKTDNEIKLFKMPHTIAKMLQAYQNNPEYAFSEAPMPYDIMITTKGVGTKEVDYSVAAARTNTPVEQETLDKMAKLTSVEDIKDRIKHKKSKELGLVTEEPKEETGNTIVYPEDEISPDSIPL